MAFKKGKRAWNFKDLTGRVFGELKVLEFYGIKDQNALWTCYCGYCGQQRELTSNSLLSIGSKHKSCGCLWKKHGKASSTEYKMWQAAKSRAKEAGLEFSLPLDAVVIPERCPILDIPLFPQLKRVGPNSPTIDRINNEKGYTKANCWIISYKANTLKNNASLFELRLLVTALMAKCWKGKLVYLASPYSHKNDAIKEMRFVEAVKCCGWFMNQREDAHFYSPIAHTHPIASKCSLPGDWTYWSSLDENTIARCNEIWILCIEGWKISTGVNAERVIAKRFGLPEKFIIPAENGYTITDIEPEE